MYILAELLKKRVHASGFESEESQAVKALQEDFALFDKGLTRLQRKVDFDFYYDVPVAARKDVQDLLLDLAKRSGLQAKSIPNHLVALSFAPIDFLRQQLEQLGSERSYADMTKALGIEIPRRECFQTDLEWQACIRLRMLGFPAFPYQGELEGACGLPMASDNPDILIRNGLRTLVECKSRAEWGDVLKFDKRIGGELTMYQIYAEQVNANAAVFICDVEKVDDEKFSKPFLGSLGRLDKVVLVLWKFFDLASKDAGVRTKLEQAVKKPNALTAEDHILP